MTKKMEFHPYSLIFPVAGLNVLEDLADDLECHGLMENIILYEGKILDGKNRYLACLKAGVEPRFTEYPGDEPLQYVISRNLHRCHFSESQRTTIAQEVFERMMESQNIDALIEKLNMKYAVPPRANRKAKAVNVSASKTVKQAVNE